MQIFAKRSSNFISEKSITMHRKPLLKVILLGDSCVGKTSLMNQYMNKRFNSIYRGTIGADFYAKDVIVGDRISTLQIWDTVGQERFQSLGVPFYRGADCVVLVFDVTSESSFKSLELWKDEFLIYGAPKEPQKFPFVVLGNKADIIKPNLNPSKIQDIVACEYEVPYFETSAKENINVEEAFTVVAKMALEREKEDILFNSLPETIKLSRNEKRDICRC